MRYKKPYNFGRSDLQCSMTAAAINNNCRYWRRIDEKIQSDPKEKLGEIVALKTMQGADSKMLALFKKEFRGLSDVVHPNLAKLYKLAIGGQLQYFTMDYVQGTDFLTFVRGDIQREEPLGETRLLRLRESFRQLAEGIAALHSSGKVHRDIKPSNVLVTTEGRVVLVDFGLAIDLNRDGIYQTVDGHVVGTPAYMSPEQAAGNQVTSASD